MVTISHTSRFISVAAFSPDARVWEIEKQRDGQLKKVSKAMDIAGHKRMVQAVALSADDALAVTAS